jgi:mannose-6-phosphate isomerase-like protein (cupin superfamily)
MSAAMTFHPKVLLHAERSEGRLSVIENVVPAGWPGPPLHRHDFDETFYVLDGQLTFQLGDEYVAASGGEMVFAPGGAAHTLANFGAGPARYLLVCTPAGFERYFARIEAEQARVEAPDWAAQEVPEVERVGPQIDEATARAATVG